MTAFYMLLVLTWKNIKIILRTDFDAVTRWSFENNVTLNAGKCHFMYLGKRCSE